MARARARARPAWGIAPSPDPEWRFVAVSPTGHLVHFGRSGRRTFLDHGDMSAIDRARRRADKRSEQSGRRYWESNILWSAYELDWAIRSIQHRDGITIRLGFLAHAPGGRMIFLSPPGAWEDIDDIII